MQQSVNDGTPRGTGPPAVAEQPAFKQTSGVSQHARSPECDIDFNTLTVPLRQYNVHTGIYRRTTSERAGRCASSQEWLTAALSHRSTIMANPYHPEAHVLSSGNSSTSQIEPPAKRYKSSVTRINSCEPCRSRKTRCDRNMPCSPCTLRAVECIWDETAREQVIRRPGLSSAPLKLSPGRQESEQPLARQSGRPGDDQEDDMAQAMTLLRQAEQLFQRASEQRMEARERKDAGATSNQKRATRTDSPGSESEDAEDLGHTFATASLHPASRASRRLIRLYQRLVALLPGRGRLNMVLDLYFARLNEGTYILDQTDFQRRLDARYPHFVRLQALLVSQSGDREPSDRLGTEDTSSQLNVPPTEEDLRLATTVTLVVLRTQLQGLPLDRSAPEPARAKQEAKESPRALLSLCQRAFTYLDPLEKISTLDDLRLCLLFVGCTCILRGTAKAVPFVITATLLCIRHGLHEEPRGDLAPSEIRDRLSLFITACTFDWVGSASLRAPSLMPFCPEKQPLLFEGYLLQVQHPWSSTPTQPVKTSIPVALHPLVLTPRMEFHFQCALVSQLLSAQRWFSPSSVEYDLKRRGTQAALHRLSLVRDRCMASSQLHGLDLIMEQGALDIVLASLEYNAEQHSSRSSHDPASEGDSKASPDRRDFAQVISIFARIVRRMAACHLGMSTEQIRSRFKQDEQSGPPSSSLPNGKASADDASDPDDYLDSIAIDVISQTGMLGLRDLWFCTQVTARALQAHYRSKEATANMTKPSGSNEGTDSSQPTSDPTQMRFLRDLSLVERAVGCLADHQGQGPSSHRGNNRVRRNDGSALVLKPLPEIMQDSNGVDGSTISSTSSLASCVGNSRPSHSSPFSIIANAVSEHAYNGRGSEARDHGRERLRPSQEAAPAPAPAPASFAFHSALPHPGSSSSLASAATGAPDTRFDFEHSAPFPARENLFMPNPNVAAEAPFDAANKDLGAGAGLQNTDPSQQSKMFFDLDLDQFLASTFF
ncbi:unnamed protein product [Parajaminaea phylloscopi]